jgi:hypothetical protein
MLIEKRRAGVVIKKEQLKEDDVVSRWVTRVEIVAFRISRASSDQLVGRSALGRL